MELQLIDLLTERIRTALDNPTYFPTQEELDAENLVYQAELDAAVLAELVVQYGSLKRESDAELLGSETEEELRAMIEVIERELAVTLHTNLVLVHTEKPELTVEMDSKAIISLVQSLESQEASAVESLRRNDLQSRLDSLGEDVRSSMQSVGEHRPNLKLFRNVELVEMEASAAETLLASIEVASVSVIAERVAKEEVEALNAGAQVVINRANAGMKFIIAFNLSKISSGELDSAGLDNLEILFAEALTKIQNIRPDKAADLIEVLDISSTLYTETERTQLINILRGL